MYCDSYEEWYDMTLYKSKESANKFLECMIEEYGFTRKYDDEVEKIGNMCRTVLRIEKFYPKEYVIVE